MQEGSHRRRQSDYLDFELEVGLGSGRIYPVAVLDSPAGEARATMHFPFDDLALENRLLSLQNALLRSGGQPRRMLSPEQQGVQDFGRELFETLFAPEVRSCYDVSLREAVQQRRGLRLKLRIHPPELAALPWEYLWHPGHAEYVSLSTRTPIVRYLEMPQRIQPLAVMAPLRILGMIASPSDLPRLDPDRERQRMERALRDLAASGQVELTWLSGQSWRDLLRAMRQGSWHVFHFIGHGGFDQNSGEGLIVLADREGRATRFDATRLGRLLADHDALRLVVLNACEGARGSERDVFSSTASILVRRGIPAVLAMQYEITDQAAIEFARTFYEAVGDGMPVDGAVAEARKAMSFSVNNTVEWGMPVLYMRSPDGVLFQQTELRPRAPAPAKGPERPSGPDAGQELERLYLGGLDAVRVEEWHTAARTFQAIVDRQPGYRDAAARLREAERCRDLARYYAQAQAAREAGDWPAALAALEPLVAQAPHFKDAAALLERAKQEVRLAGLSTQAQEPRQGRGWQPVAGLLARTRALQPDRPAREGLLAAARRKRAEARRRKELAALYHEARQLLRAKQYRAALDTWDRVRARDPQYPDRSRIEAKALKGLKASARRARAQRGQPRDASRGMACSLMALFLAIPRVGSFVLWLVSPPRFLVSEFTAIVFMLGILVLPWTAIVGGLVLPGDVAGFDWLWLGFGVFLDALSYRGVWGRWRRFRGK